MKNSMYVLCIGLLGTSVSARMVVPEDESRMSCPKIITNDKDLSMLSTERYEITNINDTIFSSEKVVRPQGADSKKSLEQLFPFELEYKEKGLPLIIDVDNGGCRIVERYRFSLMGDLILRLPSGNIDTNKEITISIWDPKSYITFGDQTKLKPTYGQVYTINANGKTVYLKYENSKLQPRVGSMFGNKTPSGLSVKNNVKVSDIRQEKIVRLKPSQPKSK
ncbi:MAG: hypothetical protein M1114_00185 [Candidatus Dependentiae bacterium]|nr:hypothetical protein [Candidatus Dependentiae bacterium]